jgi:hypothetical protein
LIVEGPSGGFKLSGKRLDHLSVFLFHGATYFFILLFFVPVSQTCDQDGMEFTLRTPEGFRGRIYTHNNYGR